MGKADYYKEGDFNAGCFKCGRKFKASELKRHWQGYWVCEEHWEARHDQDFVRNVSDTMTPAWVQATPAITYNNTTGSVTITASYTVPSGVSQIFAQGTGITVTVAAGVSTSVVNTGASAVTVSMPGGTPASITVPGASRVTVVYVGNTGTGGTGGSWAIFWGYCSASTKLPDAYTYPTTQFAGPQTTPYTPFTTVENIFVVATDCGNAIYKVKTLTYTSRTGASIYFALTGATALMNLTNPSPAMSNVAIPTYTGVSAAACYAQANTLVAAGAPSSVTLIGQPGWLLTKVGTGSGLNLCLYNWSYNGNPTAPGWAYTLNKGAVASPSYYLDVTEDWSYVLI